MVIFDKPLGARHGVNRTVNARDRRLLTEAVQAIGRMGMQRAHEVSDIPTSTLSTYAAGKLPKYLQVTTRAGLRKLLRYEEPEARNFRISRDADEDEFLVLARRACDALEEIAVALVIIADKVDPRGDL
jgi:hypothetical protein